MTLVNILIIIIHYSLKNRYIIKSGNSLHPTDTFPPNCSLQVRRLKNNYYSDKVYENLTIKNTVFELDFIKIDQTNLTNHNFIGEIDDKIYGINFTITELRINLKNSGLSWILINEIGLY